MSPLWSSERMEHLQAALDAMEDAVVVVDRDHCIVGFNRAAERLTGYPRSEALGRRCFEICAGRFCRRACDIQALFTTGVAPPDFETPVFCKDGTVRLVRVRTVPFKGRGGRITAAVQMLRDITAQLAGAAAHHGRSRGYGELVGQSPAMNRLYAAVQALQDREVPVLIAAPPGTEKEWLALTLHGMGLRSQGPFVRVLTRGMPPALIEQELFGPVACCEPETVRPGAFHLADRGTLFIDDVAHLPQPAQQRLLEYLCRGPHPTGPDVRLVAATSMDLAELAGTGRFCEELASRLLPYRLELPPLSQRPEDIPLLAEKLLAEMTPPEHKPPVLSEAALRALVHYPFPGNVEELDRVLRIACQLSRGATIEPEHLPAWVRSEPGTHHPPGPHQTVPGTCGADGMAPVGAVTLARRRLLSHPAEPSRDELVAVLTAHHWNIARCARQLGVNRTTLWRWMRRLGIDRPR